MVSPDKIAVCQSCGNEWEVKTAGIGKKRKCPLCGKYKVKMKSEMKTDEKPPETTPPEEEKTGEQEENEGEVEEKSRRKEENSPTSPRSPVTSPDFSSGEKGEENSGGGIITYAALLLLAVGAGWFLVGLVRRRRAAPVDTEYDEVEQYNPRVPAFPGF